MVANFGELLAELRQDKKLTQKELAKIIYVTPATISNYEKNIHYPDLEKLIALADFFDVTVDYLLGRSKVNLSPNVFDELVVPGKTIGTFVKEFKELPPDRQNTLLLVMQDMKMGSVFRQEQKEIC